MRPANPPTFRSRLLDRLLPKRPSAHAPSGRLAARADELTALIDVPARAEAIVQSAQPYIDRARGRRPDRRPRTRVRVAAACAVLAFVGAAAAWAAWRRHRDNEYARLVSQSDGPRLAPAASGPTRPSGPAAPPPPPDLDPAAPAPAPASSEQVPSSPAAPAIALGGLTRDPVRDPVTTSAGQTARARAQTGPQLPPSVAPSPYLRSHRADLPPVPDARPTLPG